jgi:predicted enzyme related to lactoylglutathione lyase
MSEQGGVMEERLLKHGMFSWSELMTTDSAGARKFYEQLLGWQFTEFPMENMSYWVIKAGGEEVGGIMNIPPEPGGIPPHWGVYVTVDNVDASAKKVQELGGRIMVPPTDIPDVGRFCVFHDPQGAVLSLITYLKK